jgi:hypothetical protein
MLGIKTERKIFHNQYRQWLIKPGLYGNDLKLPVDLDANLRARFATIPNMLVSSWLGGGFWETEDGLTILDHLHKTYPEFYATWDEKPNIAEPELILDQAYAPELGNIWLQQRLADVGKKEHAHLAMEELNKKPTTQKSLMTPADNRLAYEQYFPALDRDLQELTAAIAATANKTELRNNDLILSRIIKEVTQLAAEQDQNAKHYRDRIEAIQEQLFLKYGGKEALESDRAEAKREAEEFQKFLREKGERMAYVRQIMEEAALFGDDDDELEPEENDNEIEPEQEDIFSFAQRSNYHYQDDSDNNDETDEDDEYAPVAEALYSAAAGHSTPKAVEPLPHVKGLITAYEDKLAQVSQVRGMAIPMAAAPVKPLVKQNNPIENARVENNQQKRQTLLLACRRL